MLVLLVNRLALAYSIERGRTANKSLSTYLYSLYTLSITLRT